MISYQIENLTTGEKHVIETVYGVGEYLEQVFHLWYETLKLKPGLYLNEDQGVRYRWCTVQDEESVSKDIFSIHEIEEVRKKHWFRKDTVKVIREDKTFYRVTKL